VGNIFKLKTRSRAILSENGLRERNSDSGKCKVVLVCGDVDEDAFVKIRYEGKVSSCSQKTFTEAGNCGDNRHSSLSLKL
jgi:hypothetical protein